MTVPNVDGLTWRKHKLVEGLHRAVVEHGPWRLSIVKGRGPFYAVKHYQIEWQELCASCGASKGKREPEAMAADQSGRFRQAWNVTPEQLEGILRAWREEGIKAAWREGLARYQPPDLVDAREQQRRLRQARRGGVS